MAAGPAAITDFGQYAKLRAESREQNPETLRKAAQQFEALFTQQLLKSMRAASLSEDALFGSQQSEFYRHLFDQQMAVHLASGKGLGLADMLVRQLTTLGTPPPLEGEAGLNPSLPLAGEGQGRGRAEGADLSVGTRTPASLAPSPPAPPPRAGEGRKAAESFAEQILPYAAKAAQALGVSPKVIVAQAALETGWGRHVMQKSDGTPSFNFFGIKADKRWEGDRVRKDTQEYVNGKAQTESAEFRAYGSVAEAFDDYVRFLQANPRYAEALKAQGRDQHFAAGLQKAGYATDPAYAQKLLRISRSLNT